VALSLVILAAIGVLLFHDRLTRSVFTPGKTYRLAKNGVACLTLEALGKATRLGTARADEAKKFGCLLLRPDGDSHVEVLDQNAIALKVRLIAADPSVNDFTGWTDPDNVSPQAERAD
jgi:hypothetical protein